MSTLIFPPWCRGYNLSVNILPGYIAHVWFTKNDNSLSSAIDAYFHISAAMVAIFYPFLLHQVYRKCLFFNELIVRFEYRRHYRQ